MSATTASALRRRPSFEPIVAAPPAPRRDYRIRELDGLRGMAALCAVVYHYIEGPSRRLPVVAAFRTFLEATPFAIDTFFIVSGFLIGGILLRNTQSPAYYRTFYARRVSRILPIYYIWLAVYFALYALRGGGWGLYTPAGHGFLFVGASYLLLFQNFFPSIVESTYIVAPTWTLAVEEHFYLMAPPLVRRLSVRRLTHVLAGILIAAPLARAAVMFAGHGTVESRVALETWTFCRVDGIALGVLLALVWQAADRREWLMARARAFVPAIVVLTGMGLVLIGIDAAAWPMGDVIFAAFGRTVMQWCCLALMLFVLTNPASTFCGLLRSNVMREVGNISYCLYLVHWGVLWMISRFLLHSGFGESVRNDVFSAVLAFALSVLIAKVSWRFIEEPLMRRAHQRFTY